MVEVTGPRRAIAPRPFALGWWVVLVTLGAVLGLFAPAFGFQFSDQLDQPVWVAYPMIVLAGALMGLVLGVAQGTAVFGTVAAVPRTAWALVTVAGGMIAWALGLLPGTLSQIGEPLNLASRSVFAAWVAGIVVMVIAVPALQWLLLRRIVRHAGLWIPITVLAAAVGLGLAWVVLQVVDLSTPRSALVGSLVASGVLGLAFATVTGLGLGWLVRSPRRP